MFIFLLRVSLQYIVFWDVFFFFLGAHFGTVVSMPVSGILCSLPNIPGGGWPLAFYLTGGLGIVWFVAWMLLVSDTPDSHPRISESEKTYINNSLGHLNGIPNKVQYYSFSIVT